VFVLRKCLDDPHLLDRANIGAVQNRQESTVNNLSAKSTNLQASRSRVQDKDFDQETKSLTDSHMLNQAAQAMLARAEQWAQHVTQLLQ
jgi:flagellin